MADRVLITTDDLEHAVRVNAHLETAGFQTTLASSFDDVRRVVGTGAATPDCIVLTGALHESSAAQLLRIAHDRSISDRKSTRLNSSHVSNSYAVFCLKKNISN